MSLESGYHDFYRIEGIDAVDKQHVDSRYGRRFVKAIDFCLTHPQQITAIGKMLPLMFVHIIMNE